MPLGRPLASASACTRFSALCGWSEPVGSCSRTRTAPSSGSAFARSIRVSTSPVGPGLYTRPASKSRSAATIASARSEEHTSELQSRRDLVCRLLLEKKKKKEKRWKKRKKKEE